MLFSAELRHLKAPRAGEAAPTEAVVVAMKNKKNETKKPAEEEEEEEEEVAAAVRKAKRDVDVKPKRRKLHKKPAAGRKNQSILNG